MTEGLQKSATEVRMESAKKTPLMLPCILCIVGALCFWQPLVFFFAAANVMSTCEKDLGLFLKLFSTLGFGLLIVIVIMQGCAAMADRASFKCMERLVHIMGAVFQLCLWIAGIVMYTQTTDDNCYDGDADHDHYIDPRKLLIVFLCIQSVGVCGQVLKIFQKPPRQQE